MDQEKIGKFIAICRKKQNLTQAELAEKLCITDRAISKWENGRGMPDSSIMLELCNILNITVNDLLNGEVVTMSDYNVKQDELLVEMVKQKEDYDKKMLTLEIIIIVLSMSLFLGFCLVAYFVDMETWAKVLLVVSALVVTLFSCVVGIRIEQTAGYYECNKCHEKYVPKYHSVLFAMHFGRTRFMKCPKCKKYSFQKKVISNQNKTE